MLIRIFITELKHLLMLCFRDCLQKVSPYQSMKQNMLSSVLLRTRRILQRIPIWREHNNSQSTELMLYKILTIVQSCIYMERKREWQLPVPDDGRIKKGRTSSELMHFCSAFSLVTMWQLSKLQFFFLRPGFALKYDQLGASFSVFFLSSMFSP